MILIKKSFACFSIWVGWGTLTAEALFWIIAYMHLIVVV